MGFIEEMERKRQQQAQQELTRKDKLERQQQIVAQEEQNRRQEKEREKERLLGLQKESKLKFDESGVPALLMRLIKIGGGISFDAENIGDDRYHCKVRLSSEKIGHSKKNRTLQCVLL